jgi:arsenite methyltransferase
MKTTENLKEIVKLKYSEIATHDQGCCSTSCCGGDAKVEVATIMSESYEELPGYNPDADLGLGCGLPTQFARISKGDTVIDLGSGAGNDCFIAREETGETGRVIGLDFTPAMVEKARLNAQKRGYTNIEFIQGDIEQMPISDHTADVIVSNCVLNLVPNKAQAFSEIYRTLKPGGHFSISDIVLRGELPPQLQSAAEMYAGCVAGASQKEDYLSIIRDAGFVGVEIQKEKVITVPTDILSEYLNPQELTNFLTGETGIYSITVFGKKPDAAQ